MYKKATQKSKKNAELFRSLSNFLGVCFCQEWAKLSDIWLSYHKNEKGADVFFCDTDGILSMMAADRTEWCQIVKHTRDTVTPMGVEPIKLDDYVATRHTTRDINSRRCDRWQPANHVGTRQHCNELCVGVMATCGSSDLSLSFIWWRRRRGLATDIRRREHIRSSWGNFIVCQCDSVWL